MSGQDPTTTAPAGAAQANGRDHDDWDRHWEEIGNQNSRNPAVLYRARVIARLLEAEGRPRRVLDIGAGVGDFLLIASGRWDDAELAAVDVSAEGARIISERVRGSNAGVMDLTDAAAKPPTGLEAWATHAVCSEVIEHVDEPVEFLRNSRKLLAPGCRLIVTVPSGEMSAFDRHLGHRRHYTEELLVSQLDEAGIEVEEIVHAGFPFFNLYRWAVRARGEQMIVDAGAETGKPNAKARLGMGIFHVLMRLNLPRSPWGEQLVAIAREPR